MDDHNDAPYQIPLAIVGMACRLPGADDLDQYWRLLIEGRSAVVELPPDRLDQDMYYDPEVGVRGKTYSRLGAIVSSRKFDHARCPIADDLVRSIDSVHLTMCEVAASALRNAGMDPFNVPLRNTGVYIGHAQGSSLAGDYTYFSCIEGAAQFLRDVPAFLELPPDQQQAVIDELVKIVSSTVPRRTADAPDVASSLVAGAISKAFGLTGPYLAINSACASSLQSILLGARALQLGRVDMAIVGGASDCKGDTLVLFSNARAMSSTGTRPFDSEADGLVCGEGYGALVLKTLERAIADGDRIWAVIRGLGVSSDGRGKSLWAPRKEGQLKAMERAYRGGVSMSEIEYIEAHATATKLGDATELNTLTEILGQHFPPGKRIPITSAKANIGHALETAGVAGLIKTVLAMHHDTIPPAINIRELNSNIDWEHAPVYVPTKAVPWPKHADGTPRRAGINAFGIGGLNMHVVLDEFTQTRSAAAPSRPKPVSARSTDKDAIAVIGLGCVLPGAANPAEFWKLLAAGRDPKVQVPHERANKELSFKASTAEVPDASKLIGGFVTDFEYDWKRHKVPPKQVAQADPLQFMLLEAADQAMLDAGYGQRPFNRENAGVVVGTEFGGDFSCQLQVGLRLPELERHIEKLLSSRGFAPQQAKQVGADYSEALLARWPALIDETGSFSTSSLASRIGKTWNLMGGAAAIDVGEVSGLAAVSISVDMLLAGDCDLMICAAGQRRMAWPFFENLALSGSLAQGNPRSPLDSQANGQVLGEGVVVLLLKRLADAKADGDRIHAVLRSMGAAHGASSAGALQLAMERSFGSASVEPADVAVLELGALGGAQETADEVRAAAAAYGNGQRRSPLMVSTVVSQIGNTVGASSLVSMLKAILEITHGELPPAIGLDTPSQAVAQQSKTLHAPSSRAPIAPAPDGRRMAAVGTCSRGLAYHAIIDDGNPVSLAARAPVSTTAASSEPATAGAPSLEVADLEKFLVNFVVEQTGYPPEVVELDADLEADLGIDSIKKAQMFGELQEYFDVTPLASSSANENLTLDDFPTLRHIVSFLAKMPQKMAAPAPAAVPAPVAVERTPDATPTATPSPPAAPAGAPALEVAELEKFLVNFVVEQTGYPPEVVELDADLEADLGIDSIKKAQMFGELQEYFDVTALTSSSSSENLTLDDFPTLRHIVSFLASAPQKSATGSAPANAPTAAPQKTAPVAAPQVAAPPSPKPAGAAQPAAISATWQTCRFGAADPAELRRLVEKAAKDDRAWQTASARRFGPSDRFRLAVVADGPATLGSRLATALKQMETPAAQTVLEQQGIFYRQARPETRIVFLFPGQGSQYTGMLRQLVDDVPAAAAEQRSIDAVMTRLGYPTWAQLAWDESSPLGKDVWTTQISMLLADALMLSALRQQGIQPDAVAGHSYGEYAALLAAGAWDLEQAIRVTRLRCDSIEASPTCKGGMLATTATPETVEQLAARAGGPVYVANHNAPDQTVVGGSLAALTQLEHVLQEGLFETRLLAVPCPFHTPLMQDAAELFRRHISRETFESPRVTTYSVATNEPVRDSREIGANLVAHLTTPVRYADLIRKLASESPTVFVEVGPQQALTRLNRRNAGAAEFSGIACDNPARPGLEQLVRVQALLEASGALDQKRQTTVERAAQKTTSAPAPQAALPKAPGQLWHFDATARRREKMRASAQGGRQPAKSAPPAAPQKAHPEPRAEAAAPQPRLQPAKPPSNGSQETSPAPRRAPVMTPAPAPKGAAPQAPAPKPVAAPSPKSSTPKPSAAPVANAMGAAELEKFLINFVVEQTGYPPEVVELDADLEADLGIDSIKKAQMFGELQEYFDVTPLASASGSDNLTLDDFPTLRHILNFLATLPSTTPAPLEAAPAPAPIAAAPAPAPTAPPAPARPAPAVSQKPAGTTAVGSSVDVAELEKFLINFVVEQTGYPAEVVELDADLEADLGIDSIKKAQMFGELQEYFDVTPLASASGTDNLTLDDFPTLRHILNFLAALPQMGAAPERTAASGDSALSGSAGQSVNGAPFHAEHASTTAGGITASFPTSNASTPLDMIQLRGTPYEMGRQHGTEKKTEIRLLLRRIADLTDGNWSELPIPSAARSNPKQFFTADQLEELRGMADAVKVPLGNLTALNLAVLNDLAANAAQVAVVSNNGSGARVLHGFASELSLPPAVVEVLSPFIELREPATGWASATVTFAGIVGSLVGLNGGGLAASTGALLNASAAGNGSHRDGVLSVDGLLERNGALARATADLQNHCGPRAWTACLSHQGEHRVCAAEGNGVGVALLDGDTIVATNHCLLQASASPAPKPSIERLEWLRHRVAAPHSPRDAGELLSALSEMPSTGTMRMLAVVDAAAGDLLLECGAVRERVHVGALLPAAPAVQDVSVPTAVETPGGDDLAPDASDGESMRFTMRIRPFPWQATPPDYPTWQGAVAIHGNGPLADALHRRVAAGGATVVRLHETASPDAAVAEFERASREHAIAHLFLTSHRDDEPVDRTHPAEWDQLVERRTLLPFAICQRMFQIASDAQRMQHCTVVAAVDLGGDFGFSGNVAAPESGFLTGFAKGLYLECAIVRGFKNILAKAIDAPRTEPVESLAANIVRELAAGTNDYEVSFIDGKRYGQVALPVAAPLEPKSGVRAGGTWVLTGGARGITALCGLELGRRFALKLHLIGMSEPPAIDPSWRDLDEAATAELRGRVMLEARQKQQKPSDAWARVVKAIEIDRNLQAFAAAGVSCTYHACDVANRDALARVLEEVRESDGPIDGILHGAGIEQACRFEKKTREGLIATLDAKVVGAYNLMLLTRQDPVRHFIGFGSTSGRLGGNGQTDYSAASDMLCKLVAWYRSERPDCHAIGFHWHPWDELGMASRPETAAMLKANKLALMPSRVGVRHLLRELYSPPSETEVLITDWEYHQRFYPKNVDEIIEQSDLLGAPGQRVAAAGPTAMESAATGPSRKRVADRVVLRMVDAPLGSADSGRALPGEVFLLGDNADAQALEERLSAGGAKVHRLPVCDDADIACAALEKAWSGSHARCLVLLTARDPEARDLDDPSSATRRIERGVHVPYLLTQRWFQLVAAEKSSEPATIVAVTSLGGDFGFGAHVPAPEGGALSGLLKSIYVEDERFDHGRFAIKVVDAPCDEPPAELADAVCRELASGRKEVEVAWSGGRRKVVATCREAADTLPRAAAPTAGTWIVTGGARGITAAAALELGRRFKLKLHLLGKSPAPDPCAPWRDVTDEQLKSIKTQIVREAMQAGRFPAQEWDRVRKDREIAESLARFKSAGVAATYHECDVADATQLATVLDRIRAADGPIAGILHGAGYAKQFRFGTVPADSVRRVLGPKLDGTLALMQLTQNDPLRYFVAFGSLSGRFGGNGWSDYAAGNEMLAKLCGWFRERRPDCRTSCLHWQTWSDVGMAVMTDSVGINKNTFKMDFISPEEGVGHLVAELEAGLPESEVLISDGYFESVFYPYAFERPDAPKDHARQFCSGVHSPKPGGKYSAPLIHAWQADAAGGGTASVVFDPKRDPFLLEHRLKDRPFLPAVVALESLVEAAQIALGGQAVRELRSVRVVNGLAFPNDSPITTHVRMAPAEGGLTASLTTAVRDRQGRVIDAAKVLVEAFIPTGEIADPIVAAPPTSPPLGWYPYAYSGDVLLYHGGPLRCLKEVAYIYEGGWGKILAPAAAELAGDRSHDDWVLPMAVLDACEVACGSFLYLLFGGAIEVPFEFERLQWSGMPQAGENYVVQMHFRGRKDRHSLFDFTLHDRHARPILQATGYRTVLLGEGGK
jgi:acyl transferase domain-containing protein/short-subunit dehydrogenase